MFCILVYACRYICFLLLKSFPRKCLLFPSPLKWDYSPTKAYRWMFKVEVQTHSLVKFEHLICSKRPFPTGGMRRQYRHGNHGGPIIGALALCSKSRSRYLVASIFCLSLPRGTSKVWSKTTSMSSKLSPTSTPLVGEIWEVWFLGQLAPCTSIRSCWCK